MSCDDPKRFTAVTAAQLRASLGQTLLGAIDCARDVRAQLGLRPYTVTQVRVRWTGGAIGRGEPYTLASFEILPVPKIADLTGITVLATPTALREAGTILLSQVSGTYTEDQLLGRDSDGVELGRDTEMFYEVFFPLSGDRRRFRVASAPMYMASSFEWQLVLDRGHDDRTRAGEVR